MRSPGGEALPEVNLGGDSRFQGMWKDAGTGLYYVRARYYDARTGRFLSRDPAEGSLETPESFVPYVFANGNPYVFRDPTGLTSIAELEASTAVRQTQVLGQVSRNGLQFLKSIRLHGHHAIPKHLGGAAGQVLVKLPQPFHQVLHSSIRVELESAGLGAQTLSRKAFLEALKKDPRLLRTAWDAVLKASRRVDRVFGTNVTQAFWKNLYAGNVDDVILALLRL